MFVAIWVVCFFSSAWADVQPENSLAPGDWIDDTSDRNGVAPIDCQPAEILFQPNPRKHVKLTCKASLDIALKATLTFTPSYGERAGQLVQIYDPKTTANPDFKVGKDGTILYTIENPRKEDDGIYKFLAPVSGGRPSEGTIVLEVRPFIQPFPDKKTAVYDGERVVLACHENTGLNITFAWQKDGADFMPNSSTTTLEDNGFNQSSLIFNPVHYEDEAEYTCIVTGQNGNDSDSTLLRVKDPLRWAYAFIGIILCILTVAAVLLFDNWYKKEYPYRTITDSEAMMPVIVEEPIKAPEPRSRLCELASLPLGRLMTFAQTKGYPLSVVYAAIKWRAMVEKRRNPSANADGSC